MGNAVFAKGQFFIFGGETTGSPLANDNNVYNRIDQWDPSTNTWCLQTFQVARHGNSNINITVINLLFYVLK
jgi:hypothetical protein